MKGCGWMTYHLTAHTIIIPMSKKTYIFLHERDRQTEGSGRMQKVFDTLVGAANQMER